MHFRALFAQAIERCGISRSEFARRVGYHQPSLHQVLQGQRRPPLNRMDAWCHALGLEGEDRQQFRIAWFRLFCPQEIRDHLDQQELDLAKLRDELERLRNPT